MPQFLNLGGKRARGWRARREAWGLTFAFGAPPAYAAPECENDAAGRFSSARGTQVGSFANS